MYIIYGATRQPNTSYLPEKFTLVEQTHCASHYKKVNQTLAYKSLFGKPKADV